MNNRRQSRIILLILLLSLPFTLFGEVNVERDPVAFGMFLEYGQIVNGWEFAERDIQIRGAIEEKMGIFILQRAQINNKLQLNIGVGGLFLYVPQVQGLEHTIGAKFGPGIAEANLAYHFGDIDKGDMWFKIGYWPMKYNQNAANLGEYLYRSGTYPGYLKTGGWAVVNYAFYYAQGLQFHYEMLDGMLTHDFTLFLETNYFPNHDLTPTYLVNLNTGIFEVGAGASFSHLIAMKPSFLRPKHEESTYLTFNSFPDASPVYDDDVLVMDTVVAGQKVEGLMSGLLNYKTQDPFDPTSQVTVVSEKYWDDGTTPGQDNLMESQITSLSEKLYCHNTIADSCTGLDMIPVAEQVNYTESEDNRYTITDDFVWAREEYYYTHRGIKLMLMAALDFKPMLGMEDNMSPKDMRIYTEAAVLGVEDQPFYYDDITKRIPVMFGVNLPTFKILDLIAVQAEYYNSDWDNNIETYYKTSLPVWYLPQGKPWAKQTTAHDDNWQWSVLASKTWAQSVSFSLQVANDHLRTFDEFVQPFVGTVLPVKENWYWMARLDVNI